MWLAHNPVPHYPFDGKIYRKGRGGYKARKLDLERQIRWKECQRRKGVWQIIAVLNVGDTSRGIVHV